MPKTKVDAVAEDTENPLDFGCSCLPNSKKQFKKEVMDVFRKFGYLAGENDYDVTFKITSGNVAWINIKRIETIK